MVFQPKCVLVTGATSKGIGRSLAHAIYDLPSEPKVIITGRRQDRLDAFSAGKDRAYGKKFDQMVGREDLISWVASLLSDHPDLDTIVLNAGIQLRTNFAKAATFDLEAVSVPPINEDCPLAYLSCPGAAGE